MANPHNCPPLTRPSIIAAHALIKQYIHYTPVLTNHTLTDLASTPQSADALADTPWAGQVPSNPKLRLWFKCENLQRVGAFKVRGAFHALRRLVVEKGWEEDGSGPGSGEEGQEKTGKKTERAVVTHSSGNSILLYFDHARSESEVKVLI